MIKTFSDQGNLKHFREQVLLSLGNQGQNEKILLRDYRNLYPLPLGEAPLFNGHLELPGTATTFCPDGRSIHDSNHSKTYHTETRGRADRFNPFKL